MIVERIKIFHWIRSHTRLFWLAGILLASFILKLLCWYLDPIVSRDGCLYIRLAQIWYDTGNFKDILRVHETGIPPMFLYLMKCLMELGLSAENAGVWLNLILGTFTPLLAYGMAYEVTQRKDIAVCSAVLIACNPSMNEFSVEIQRDMIYLFLIGLVLWLLAAGIRRKCWSFWAWSGLTAGCSMLVRYETLEMLIIVPVILIQLCAGRYLYWKKCLCYAGLFYSGLVITVCSLSLLMQVQETVFENYKIYYDRKWDALKMQLNIQKESLQ